MTEIQELIQGYNNLADELKEKTKRLEELYQQVENSEKSNLSYFGMLKDITGLKINKKYTVGKKCLGCYYKGFYHGKEVCVTEEKCWRLKK